MPAAPLVGTELELSVAVVDRVDGDARRDDFVWRNRHKIHADHRGVPVSLAPDKKKLAADVKEFLSTRRARITPNRRDCRSTAATAVSRGCAARRSRCWRA